MGALASLEKLSLADNQVGDAGLSALAEAVGKGALASLKTLRCGGRRRTRNTQH